MLKLLQATYLLDNKIISREMDKFWKKYQKILSDKKVNWNKINEARAILYFLGYLYPEKIALESLERRVKLIKPKISLDKFLLLVDQNKILKKYQRNKSFLKLSRFYKTVKTIKNKVKNNSYLDEERFNKLYNSLRPKNYF